MTLFSAMYLYNFSRDVFKRALDRYIKKSCTKNTKSNLCHILKMYNMMDTEYFDTTLLNNLIDKFKSLKIETEDLINIGFDSGISQAYKIITSLSNNIESEGIKC